MPVNKTLLIVLANETSRGQGRAAGRGFYCVFDLPASLGSVTELKCFKQTKSNLDSLSDLRYFPRSLIYLGRCMSEVIITPEDVVLDVSYLYYLNTASPLLLIPLLFLSSSPPCSSPQHPI